jgi:hypothetical protein
VAVTGSPTPKGVPGPGRYGLILMLFLVKNKRNKPHSRKASKRGSNRKLERKSVFSGFFLKKDLFCSIIGLNGSIYVFNR